MGKWSELSAKQKATVIKMALGNGVSDINTIRDTYNIYSAPTWTSNQENYDYDMAAAKAAGIKADYRGHYPDAFKKPNHPTFSTESMYSDPIVSGGKWSDDYSSFTPSDFQKRNWTREELQEALKNQGDENVVLNYAEGGSIHIKHPGRLTALKKRTGKTEAELWRTGSAAVRKMITFARNARKWHKHDQASPESIADVNSGWLNIEQQGTPEEIRTRLFARPLPTTATAQVTATTKEDIARRKAETERTEFLERIRPTLVDAVTTMSPGATYNPSTMSSEQLLGLGTQLSNLWNFSASPVEYVAGIPGAFIGSMAGNYINKKIGTPIEPELATMLGGVAGSAIGLSGKNYASKYLGGVGNRFGEVVVRSGEHVVDDLFKSVAQRRYKNVLHSDLFKNIKEHSSYILNPWSKQTPYDLRYSGAYPAPIFDEYAHGFFGDPIDVYFGKTNTLRNYNGDVVGKVKSLDDLTGDLTGRDYFNRVKELENKGIIPKDRTIYGKEIDRFLDLGTVEAPNAFSGWARRQYDALRNSGLSSDAAIRELSDLEKDLGSKISTTENFVEFPGYAKDPALRDFDLPVFDPNSYKLGAVRNGGNPYLMGIDAYNYNILNQLNHHALERMPIASKGWLGRLLNFEPGNPYFATFKISPEPEDNANSVFLNRIHSTGGPLYPFSFEKNPYLKTPVVRYDEGGPMNSEFLPSDSVQNKQVWLNKGTRFQKQMPGTVNIQNIQDALNPGGSDIQYIWDSPEKESYSAFRRNPDYRAPLLPSVKVGPQALSVAPVSIPKINVSIPKPNFQLGYTESFRNINRKPENWVPMETAWNPGYGYETFHLDNSPYYGIKYYSVPGSINAGEGNRAVLDSVVMGLPIQALNSRLFDYKLKHKDWGEFNKVE